MNDDLLFAEDVDEEPLEDLGHWKVLIVDDEPEVHAVTKLALGDFLLNGKTLKFLSAYSGAEAKKLFREHDDIAVVLLDVVMESDDAGLEVADYVRNDLDNHFTRIILRTGQPGQAPEKDVIINYDINDYKSKTELTAQKLFTVIIAALRSYRDIMVIEENRAGLEKIIDASADLFSTRSLEKLMQGLIQQLSSILGCTKDAAYITTAVAIPNPINQSDPDELYVFAGNGEYAGKEGKPLREALSEEQYHLCQQALKKRSVVYAEDHVVAYCDSKAQNGSLLYLSGLPRRIGDTDKRLVQLFSDNVQIALENVLINTEIAGTQREIVERMAQVAEQNASRSKHIKKMVEMAEALAKGVGMEEKSVTTLCLAIPLHDVGNTSISTKLLNKQGALTEDEKFEIRRHAELGYSILKDSDRATIQLAATLARQHHEHWDGSGYPGGLKGDEIVIESRITALVDVFTAIMTSEARNEKIPLDTAIDTLRQKRGTHFDPALVDYLLNNLETFVQIQLTSPDK